MKFKKLLWLVPDPLNAFFAAYGRQFTAAGCRVTLYPYRERLLEIGLLTMQEELRELATVHDVVFVSLFSGTFEISPDFCASLHERTPIVLWAADDELYSTQQTVFYAGVVDAVISADYWGRGLLDQLGMPTFYFPLHNPDITAPGDLLEKTIDVSFVGNCTVADRWNYLTYLIANGINVETYGHGSANGYVSQDRYIEIVRRSRISLNFTQANFSTEDYAREPWRRLVRQLKGRPFEVASLGSFCLSEYAPHLDAIFSEDKEIGMFHDKQTLLAQVRHYLANDSVREAMALAAKRRIDNHYSMPECLLSLMTRIESSIARRRQFSASGGMLPVSEVFAVDQYLAALKVSAAMCRRGRVTMAFVTLAQLPSRYRRPSVIYMALCELLRQLCRKLLR